MLEAAVAVQQEYSFVAEAGVTYYLYAATTNGLYGMAAVICQDSAGNTIYTSNAQAYAEITVAETGTYTFKITGVNLYGKNTIYVSTEAPATAA